MQQAATPTQRFFLNYAATIAATMVIVAIRWALHPLMGDVSPLIFFLISVAFSAWFGGVGPGMFATILGLVVGMLLFSSPHAAPVAHSAAFDWLARGIPFLIVGSLLTFFATKLEAARLRAIHDSAERRSIEQSLHRTEDLQSRIFDSAKDFSIFTTDANGLITSWSIGAEHVFQYTEAEIVDQPCDVLFTDEDRAAGTPAQELATALRDGRSSDERWHLRKDGSRFFASGAVTPLRDESDQFVGYVKIARDVTEQHNTRLALAAARNRTDAALIAAEMGTYDWHVQGDRVYGDSNFARLFAIERDANETVSLKDCLARIHPDDVTRARDEIRASVDSGNDYECEYRIITPRGERTILARGRMAKDAAGQVIRFPGVVLDITDRKRLEQEQRFSEDRYRRLFESVEEGFCIFRMLYDDAGKPIDYRFVEVNPAFAIQTDLPDAAGKTIRELVPTHEQHWFDTYDRIVKTGKAETFQQEAAGLHRHYEVTAFRLGDPAEQMVAALFKDVTHRRQIEIDRQALLESESAARAAAENASRMKDEFLATISHELRTPLAAIVGWANLLQRPGLDATMQTEGIFVIARNAQAQSQLIEDILDMSRITSGKMRLHVQQIDARQPILSAITTVANGAAAKDIRIHAKLGDDKQLILGDPDRLQQVFWNLLANAIKFTPNSGSITITLARTASRLVASVSDTGRGMDPRFLPHAFDRFRQADMSSTRQQGGLGLGLSIVRNLVELHGGTVAVNSDGENQGSTFTVDLPVVAVQQPALVAPTPARTEAAAAASPQELSGLRVLVLDDHEDARRIIQATLEQFGCDVDIVGTVADAIGVLNNAPRFDAIISDVGMPGEDGYVFIRRFREMESKRADRRTPVAALTAYTRPTDRADVLAAGFDQYLAKPVLPNDLLAAMRSLVSGAKASTGNSSQP